MNESDQFEWTNAQTMAAVAYIEQNLDKWAGYVNLMEGATSYGADHIPHIQNLCRPKMSEATIAIVDWHQVAEALFVQYVVLSEMADDIVDKMKLD